MGKQTEINAQISSEAISKKDSTLLSGSQEDIQKLIRDLSTKVIEEEVKKLRGEFILIFGLFASLVAFLAIEVNIFKYASRLSAVMGISFFFLSAIMMFVLALKNITEDRNKLKDYWNAVFILSAIFLAASIACFWWYVKHLK